MCVWVCGEGGCCGRARNRETINKQIIGEKNVKLTNLILSKCWMTYNERQTKINENERRNVLVQLNVLKRTSSRDCSTQVIV